VTGGPLVRNTTETGTGNRCGVPRVTVLFPTPEVPVIRSTAPLRTVALAFSLLLVAGCGSDEGFSADAPSAGQAQTDGGGDAAEQPPTSVDSEGEAPAGAAAPGAPGAAAQARVAPPSSFARVGELTVEVPDVARAAEQATRLVMDSGGRLESEQRGTERDSGIDYATASLRLRVLPESFDATVAGLSGLGEERSRNLGGEELGDQIVDLEARLATQRASVARVRALLEQAEDLTEIMQVEAELTRRTADLESLEARLNAFTARIETFPISLRLVAEEAPEAAAGPPGFRDGLSAGWEAVVAIARTIGVTAGVLLPFAPLLLVLGYVGWRVRRRRAVAPGGPAGATA
jgi:hypothetical protein